MCTWDQIIFTFSDIILKFIEHLCGNWQLSFAGVPAFASNHSIALGGEILLAFGSLMLI